MVMFLYFWLMSLNDHMVSFSIFLSILLVLSNIIFYMIGIAKAIEVYKTGLTLAYLFYFVLSLDVTIYEWYRTVKFLIVLTVYSLMIFFTELIKIVNVRALYSLYLYACVNFRPWHCNVMHYIIITWWFFHYSYIFFLVQCMYCITSQLLFLWSALHYT